MKLTPKTTIDRAYIQSARRSTPEQRLEWLAAAQEFASAPKKIIENKNKKSQ